MLDMQSRSCREGTRLHANVIVRPHYQTPGGHQFDEFQDNDRLQCLDYQGLCTCWSSQEQVLSGQGHLGVSDATGVAARAFRHTRCVRRHIKLWNCKRLQHSKWQALRRY